MKNRWLELAGDKNHKKKVNGWLTSVWLGHDPNELGYALYDLINLIYSKYSMDFVSGYDKEDIVQECVLNLLKHFNEESSDDDLFLTLCNIVVETMNDLTSGLSLDDKELDNLLEGFHENLKKSGKL